MSLSSVFVRDTCLSSWRNSCLLLDAKSFIWKKTLNSPNAVLCLRRFCAISLILLRCWKCPLWSEGPPCSCRAVLTGQLGGDADLAFCCCVDFYTYVHELDEFFISTRVELSVYCLSRQSLWPIIFLWEDFKLLTQYL